MADSLGKKKLNYKYQPLKQPECNVRKLKAIFYFYFFFFFHLRLSKVVACFKLIPSYPCWSPLEAALAHAQQHTILSDAETGISQRLAKPQSKKKPLSWWLCPGGTIHAHSKSSGSTQLARNLGWQPRGCTATQHPCAPSAIPGSDPLTVYGVRSHPWPCSSLQSSSEPSALGRVTANISQCFQHCSVHPVPVNLQQETIFPNKHPEMHSATPRINL